MKEQAIGIFDSGLGGLTVWKELKLLLPHESFIYFADRARCPYGPKRKNTIQRFSDEITNFLLQQNCKLIVVACNTATSAAIKFLRTKYDVPFIGIEPAIKPAAIRSETGKIGILATRGTINGELFKTTSKKFADHLEVVVQYGDGLVALVEANAIHEKRTEDLLRRYIDPMLEKGVDHIVLGCTHYPFLTPIIESIVQGKATIINPAPAVARQTHKILKQKNLLRSKNTLSYDHFYSSNELSSLASMLQSLAINLPNANSKYVEHYQLPTLAK
ncbi:MAG: glutamate racemase [Saprospiraceae bacterium]